MSSQLSSVLVNVPLRRVSPTVGISERNKMKIAKILNSHKQNWLYFKIIQDIHNNVNYFVKSKLRKMKKNYIELSDRNNLIPSSYSRQKAHLNSVQDHYHLWLRWGIWYPSYMRVVLGLYWKLLPKNVRNLRHCITPPIWKLIDYNLKCVHFVLEWCECGKIG